MIELGLVEFFDHQNDLQSSWITLSGPIHHKAGDVVVHEPYDKHSMVTKESSVLVCWVNSGDTFGEYYFVKD